MHRIWPTIWTITALGSLALFGFWVTVGWWLVIGLLVVIKVLSLNFKVVDLLKAPPSMLFVMLKVVLGGPLSFVSYVHHKQEIEENQVERG